jgi:hypothetical protein
VGRGMRGMIRWRWLYLRSPAGSMLILSWQHTYGGYPQTLLERPERHGLSTIPQPVQEGVGNRLHTRRKPGSGYYGNQIPGDQNMR